MVLISSYPGPIFRRRAGTAIPALRATGGLCAAPVRRVGDERPTRSVTHGDAIRGILSEDRCDAGWYGLY